ncbi:hypothetical protein [Nonomuraea sp. GTA35]|uniref:hypothetical protein n=1 Tax=Nonomuraea sp. GTA35 TaxID=1676746 RepID=UPI0035C202E5
MRIATIHLPDPRTPDVRTVSITVDRWHEGTAVVAVADLPARRRDLVRDGWIVVDALDEPALGARVNNADALLAYDADEGLGWHPSVHEIGHGEDRTAYLARPSSRPTRWRWCCRGRTGSRRRRASV